MNNVKRLTILPKAPDEEVKTPELHILTLL